MASARRVHDALVAGQVDRLPEVPSPVRPSLAPGAERVLAVGAFELATFGPDLTGIADGTTAPVDLRSAVRAVRSRGSGDGWGAAVAETFGARWRTTHRGGLTVTTHGMYLDYGTVVHPWGWAHLTHVQLAAPGSLQYVARGTGGTLPWRLGSVWAELLFVLWTWDQQRDHPQLTSGAWVGEETPGGGSADGGSAGVDAGRPVAEGGWVPAPEVGEARDVTPVEAAAEPPAEAAFPEATPAESAEGGDRGVEERIRDLLAWKPSSEERRPTS